MAKQGSIKHYRQANAQPAPAALPYGELAVAKDGTLYAGNESGVPVNLLQAAGVPGMVTAFAGAAAPTGWLFCNGAQVNRTTYAALFAAIGTTYGAGNGSTTFTLPDMRGYVPVGTGVGLTLGAKGGEALHTISVPEIASHKHGATNGGRIMEWMGDGAGNANLTAIGGTAISISWDTTAVGLNQPMNNMQPSIGMNYIIKY